MKKFFLLCIFVAIGLAIVIRFLPLTFLQKLPLTIPAPVAEYLRPELLPVVTIEILPPVAKILDKPKPLWQGDLAKQKQLVPLYKFGPAEARRRNVKLNHLNFIAAGDTFVSVIDIIAKEMLIFTPELKLIRRWPMLSGLARLMKATVALTARNNEIAALDQDGRLAIWNAKGHLQGSFKIRGTGRDLALLAHGLILVHQTSPYPYLLALYNRRGRKLKQFAAYRISDSTEAVFLNQAHLAVNRRGQIALGFIYPYQLLFFNSAGYPRLALKINPGFFVQPPIFDRKNGQIIRMIRQSIIYDVYWFQNRLYVLVAPEQAKAASYLDVFSIKGEFQERFYLPLNVLKMTSHGNSLYFLSYWPKYRIEAFKIEKIRYHS